MARLKGIKKVDWSYKPTAERPKPVSGTRSRQVKLKHAIWSISSFIGIVTVNAIGRSDNAWSLLWAEGGGKIHAQDLIDLITLPGDTEIEVQYNLEKKILHVDKPTEN